MLQVFPYLTSNFTFIQYGFGKAGNILATDAHFYFGTTLQVAPPGAVTTGDNPQEISFAVKSDRRGVFLPRLASSDGDQHGISHENIQRGA